MESTESLIRQQIKYYQARASEYDEWFLRQGRYDRGPEWNAQWFGEIEQVRQALAAFKPAGRILELACGTGLWTQYLLSHAEHIIAVDAVPEVLRLNRQRLQSSKVTYVQADIFTWTPAEKFDVIFFSFWLSHVPHSHFESFWEILSGALKAGGRVFFIDSLYEPASTAQDHHLEAPETGTVLRKLNNGQEFSIVKIFYKKAELADRLHQLGWRISVYETPHYFLYGTGGLDTLPVKAV